MSHSYNQRTVRDDMWMIIIKIGKWWPKIHSLFIIRIFGNHFRIPPVGLTQSRRKEKGKWESFEPNRRHWTVLGWSLCRFPTVPGSVHPGSPHGLRRVMVGIREPQIVGKERWWQPRIHQARYTEEKETDTRRRPGAFSHWVTKEGGRTPHEWQGWKNLSNPILYPLGSGSTVHLHARTSLSE